MTKIKITKPTGVEELNLISAFKAENNSYIVLNSDKIGSMGLPIIYISKLTTKLEKIASDIEWQSLKNYLKGIIGGTNFEYIKVDENLSADEAYYTPLTLPQASLDIIKERYVIKEDNSSTTVITPNPNTTSNETISVTPIVPEATITPNETPSSTNIPTAESVSPSSAIPVENPSINSDQTFPTMPDSSVNPNNESSIPSTSTNVPSTTLDNNFAKDKETFLKACENMFDAMVAKYQKELSSLEQREQELIQKEEAIATKLKNADEHLANAEAKEQIANIAHDNAQKVMDLNNFMPVNPNSTTETSVI